MKTKHSLKMKSVMSAFLAVVMILGTLPVMNVFAAQKSDYEDPADNWLKTNNRTNELDMNATVTYETQWCPVCNKDTTVLTYRVPEYTKSGQTAMNHGVKWSDGYDLEGKKKGNTDSGTPGVDASYTGYHYTKSVCQTCGTINSVDGSGAYNFNNNVYGLNSCDHNFFIDFDNTTYELYDEHQHTTVLKKGEYCQFCKGTYAKATIKKESHDLASTVDGQVGNNRFYLQEECEDCGYKTTEYISAKAVISSYYGMADGDSHSISVSDLSDKEVHTKIRYGTAAGSCNMTSAPNYTKAGYYPVYYEIDYKYGTENMTENGVSYVWLLADDSKNNNSDNQKPVHEHDYRYIETVKPTCTELGYERWQCNTCGSLEKKNYVQTAGHTYKTQTIREATCRQGGLVLEICTKCGDFNEKTTPTAGHHYHDTVVNATCINAGYILHSCDICGESYITNTTPYAPHNFKEIVKNPTCTDGGYTTHICETCHMSYTDNYKDALGHSWDKGHNVTDATCDGEGVIEYNCLNCNEKMIKAESAKGHTPGKSATCTEPQTCVECGAILELPKGHSYKTKTVKPTCTSMGYTVYSCKDCDNTYEGDYIDKLPHNYGEKVTEPTCTAMGYTTFTCADCGEEYVSDYTDKIAHNYAKDVTEPTCTSVGFTTYTCVDCGETYKADYTDVLPHNYNKKTVEPTCTEHGYAVFTCPDCGKSYIGEYTDVKKHHYTKVVTPPTCTEMGYTTYTCDDCGDSYKADYVDKAAHDYTKTVTAPTCTTLGFTTYECKNCDYKYISNYTDKINHSYIADVTEPTCTASGYTVYTCEKCGKTYTADYKDMTGHNPSDWIIDIPATIEQAGEKHIECITCGEVLSRTAIPQLVEKDRTDEDGNSKVGDFSILVTNANGKPIFDSEIIIDINDNVTIKLPSGRLLDYEDQTIITAINTDSQQPKSELQIFVYDENNNAATGKTDENGQLKVPNNKTSTGDNSGTVGKDDEDKKNTFVVKATDKMNVVIPNCEVYIGESNNIVVDLPDGIKPTSEYPVIITVTDQHGQPQQGVTVITLGDADYIEKGITDMFGKITLPTAKDGFTDDTGKVRIDGMYVFVNDESGAIENAFVKLNDDSTISVTLPDGTNIDYSNRITVTVTDKDGNPLKDISVTVSDTVENSLTDKTDENGKIVVPPLNEDITDENGVGKVNGYNVVVTDEKAPIANAFITISEDGRLSVKLPEANKIDIENRISVVVTDSEDKPVKGMSVTITETAAEGEAKTAVDVTDENGRATVPPTNIDVTDFNGYGEVDGYIVIVKNAVGAIEKAHITHNAEVKNEDGTVKSAENISVELPENIKFDYANRITVSVAKKADNTAVKDMSVIVSEKAIEDTETKSLTGITDKDGVIILPPASEGITDKDGKTDISETIPGKDTDGDGKEDTEESKTEYNITVEDTKGKIENAYIEIKDGKITVTLPDTHTLTTSNQTTVTVLDKDNKGVANVSVTVTDKNKTTATKSTDTNGKITVPFKSTGGGSSSGGGGRGGSSGGSYISSNVTNITVTDKDGKNVSASKSTDKDGNITLILPNGAELIGDNYYTIKATDSKGNSKADVSIILKDKKNNTANGTTDKNGTLILPASEHKAYIFGYEDGTFRPDNNMSRAEAAAIFARLISEKKDEKISGKSNFNDVSKNEWYSDYIGYLSKYGIIKGYSDNTFRPNDNVSRAEFVAMTVRFNALFNEVKKDGYTVKYTDVASNYWAYSDIAYAKNVGWLNGYADGTFKGDNAITRAEVVTVVNRATGRKADESYITKNVSVLNKFTDIRNNSMWYYADVMEAANTHLANSSNDNETWVK